MSRENRAAADGVAGEDPDPRDGGRSSGAARELRRGPPTPADDPRGGDKGGGGRKQLLTLPCTSSLSRIYRETAQ
jgi:hypothetical protein